MPKLLCSFTHHHDSSKSPWKAFVASEAEALEQALQAECGQQVLREPAETVLARAREAGPYGTTARSYDEGYPDEAHVEEDSTVVVWDYVEDGKRNFGCGVGGRLEETDKRENVWLHLEEWSPDPKKKAELDSLSKEDLVQRLLEVEAVR